MICPECNTRNPESAAKCVHCGKDLPESDAFDSGPGTFSGMKTTMSVETIESTLKKGAIFAGRYEILNDGFKGGMGIVFKVKDNILNDVKALKVILPSYLDNEKAITRFKQEVATSQKLVHENIVRVYDIGESADKVLYFTMEWVEGISLREFINERKKYDKKLTLEEVKYLIGQICSALSYAHKTIIHRDIKPENVLVTDSNSKKPKLQIADFGIAKAESQSIHVSVSAYMGTPIYMAPEQYNDAAHADKRADIYSVGVILYELLSFNLPLGTFPMPSEVNPSYSVKIDSIIKKALNPDRSKRYDDALDIVKELDGIGPAVIKPGPVNIGGDIKKGKEKSYKVPVIVGACVACLVLAGLIYGLQGKKENAASPAPAVSALDPPGAAVSPASKITKRGAGPKKEILTPQASLPPKEEHAQVPVASNKVPDQVVAEKAPIITESIPLSIQVNIIGQRKIGENNYEEVIIREGSTLKSDDNFHINVSTSRECYIYVIIFDSMGKANLLFPSSIAGHNNRIKGNVAYSIPSGNDWFYLDENTGTETIYVLADINQMNDIDNLLANMDKKGSRQQKEDANILLSKIKTRGVAKTVRQGAPKIYKTSDGDTIKNITQIVEGKGAVTWVVRFKHI